MFELIQSNFELLSLAMTIPTVLLGIGVVVLFWPAARQAIVGESRDAQGWLIMGIWFGFLGSCLDNAYWSAPWTAFYIGQSELGLSLTQIGVFFNVTFRQGFGISAAYCHLRASQEEGDINGRGLNALLAVSSVLGMLYSLILFTVQRM